MKILYSKIYINFYFSSNLGSIIGFLKVGVKHLYVYDSHGQVHERTPLCLLDFYVHESKQRSGYGKKLFDVMLEVNS
jgi:alpha-tubulin N-acetyltransferase 1